MECLFTLQSRDWILRIMPMRRQSGIVIGSYKPPAPIINKSATKRACQRARADTNRQLCASRSPFPSLWLRLMAARWSCLMIRRSPRWYCQPPCYLRTAFTNSNGSFFTVLARGVMRRGWSIICSGSASRFASKAGMDCRSCWGIQYRQRSRHTCTPLLLSAEIGCRKSCSRSADALVRGLPGQAGYPPGCAADPSGAG